MAEMPKSKLFLIFLAATAAVAGGVRGSQVLSAQVLRCWDVVCTVDAKGTMSCVETPRPCPPTVT
jgi:hypothetical protein